MTELVTPLFTSPAEEGSDPAMLPRLLYIGDIRVESTVAGAALLYRLLESYPADRLLICETNIFASQRERRLPNVQYHETRIKLKRLLFSRFNQAFSSYLWWAAPLRTGALRKRVVDFQPEAILTLAHGTAWVTAATLAASLKIPLHLVVHDEWIETFSFPAKLRARAHRTFAKTYKQARSRLCISPTMVELYEERYGCKGSVLYPLRTAGILPLNSPAPRRSKDALTFAYAGTLSSPAYVDAMLALTRALAKAGHKLLAYTNRTELCGAALNGDAIDLRPLVPVTQLVQDLRKQADVLFLPMPFDPCLKTNMQVSFPSKLADYTAIGLPILIYGPPYCSAIRWACENPGVAETVETEDPNSLLSSVIRLASDFGYRDQLASRALEAGTCFSHEVVTSAFHRHLQGDSSCP